MTQRRTILDQIKTDIEDKWQANRGYNYTPIAVKRGNHKWNDFDVKPVICYSMFRDENDEDSEHGALVRWINLYIYGYADTDGNGNTDVIHDLAEDCENFLNSTDFTYTNNTLIGDTEIFEGGLSNPINSFLITIKVMYET